MATYSTSLQLKLITDGTESGTWGNSTNTNWNLMEQAVTGVQSITMINADYTLSVVNGASDEARNAVLVVSGTNSAIRKIIAPLVPKVYMVYNNTSGGYAITIGGSTGSVATIPSATTCFVYCDGTNFYSGTSGSPGNFNIAGSETVAGSVSIGGNLAVTGTTTFTGIPSGPTASPGTNTTQLATTAYVLANGVPSGAIMLWSGSIASIPSGWYLCNGSNSTPDLRDRFIVGAGSTYSVATTGGSADAVVVSHTHTATSSVTDPGHYHTVYANPGGGSGAFGGGSSGGATNINSDVKTTGISVSTSVSTAGSSGTNANLPPYYALCYIMKA